LKRELKDILQYKGIVSVHGPADQTINALTLDSRKVEAGSMFFAVKGSATDAHKFIPSVEQAGATVIVCSDVPEKRKDTITYVQVDDVQQSVGYFASAYYDFPSEKLKLIGVTGTNGKTSTCTMLYQLFSSLGSTCGLISTVEYKIGDNTYSSTHTTPDPIRLNGLLSEMNARGCAYCFMEVSSHSIDQGRINGLHFTGGVFTNITHDHLDYHKTFDQYLKTKKLFFDRLPDDAFALSNRDDRNGMVMLQNTKAGRFTYALQNPADFRCRILECDFAGLLLKFEDQETWFGITGRFNAYNILAVYSTAFLLGVSKMDILTHLSRQGRVNGRFEVYKSKGGIIGIVDYAHTPDALENVLSTIKDIRTGNEQLITVAGCGGDRDKEKRPLMGKTCARMSDKVIFTSDNPRNEDPLEIIESMMMGVEASDYKKVLKISDRREAIRTAVMLSKKGDIILIAGKGHETYQEIKGVKHPFDDRVQLNEIFKEN
jgi:UDP-N-acetylmuramoyl-L-alanyl-D-glutamate--2,6-diaminopimelate ligase